MVAGMVGPVFGLNSRVELDCVFVALYAVITDFRVLEKDTNKNRNGTMS